MKKALLLALTLLNGVTILAQDPFKYSVNLNPVNIPNISGLHSYTFATQGDKWLIIGGRKDGLHPRQPFNAFSAAQNNTDIYVIDIQSKQVWSSPVTSLPTVIAEQLQSTNMNFTQKEDTLYIIGGYAYSSTDNDHKTFSGLITVQVSEVIQAVINNTSINSYFKQIADTAFAVTGAHLVQLDDTFYLVGGHRFDGRYNPMGNPTYTQSYTNQIRMFRINNSGSQLSFSDYSTITDPVHLRRRDYNLLPQIFPDGTKGLTISSGVFQQGVDLPFLYPVDIRNGSYTPVTSFNQYLSNYHSANTALYDSVTNSMHMLFYGGISQYFYRNGALIKDDNVPFVKTISRLTRLADGTLKEYKMDEEMPGLKGASAEFIPANNIERYESDIIKLHKLTKDTTVIGYVYGGINSTSENPFSNNQTGNTNADNVIYEVRLIKQKNTSAEAIHGVHQLDFEVYPNPFDKDIFVQVKGTDFHHLRYFLTSIDGRMITSGELLKTDLKDDQFKISSDTDLAGQRMLLTLVFDNIYYATNNVIRK